MNVIFPMYFGEKRGCSSAGSSSSSRKLKKCFSCYTYALEWGQQQCPCKFQLLVFLNTPNSEFSKIKFTKNFADTYILYPPHTQSTPIPHLVYTQPTPSLRSVRVFKILNLPNFHQIPTPSIHPPHTQSIPNPHLVCVQSEFSQF